MGSRYDKLVARILNFDDAVKQIRKDAPVRVTDVSYDGLKFALDCGIDCRARRRRDLSMITIELGLT